MATKSEISCSVTVPAMSKRMLKMPCGTSSSSEFNSTVALEGYQIPTKPVKQYDEVSCCSYTTAIDLGMKSNNFRSGSGEKPSYKTIHQIMQKEELGSLEISCTSGKGHEEVVGSIFQEESAEVEVLDDSVLGLVLNEQPESGIKHSIEEEPAEVKGLEDFVSGLVSNEQPNSGIKHSIDDPETCIDFAFDPCEEVNEQRNNGQFTSLISAVQCQSPDDSLCNATEYAEAKDSFGTTRVGGNSTGSVHKSSTYYRGSTGSDVSDESILSIGSGSGAMNKPHQANDTRWEAIQTVRSRNNGTLGLNNFRLLRKLGCGDIGSVYLSELIGFKVHYAMKIMDKAALQSRKKLPRAQTEREILQCLDHPFLPTLYAHFETEKFSCLVMEFCPGGDLHALRQRQPGKHFSEHAARFYVAEVLLALEYLHMLGIIYRDLKPENVLVRDDGHIMLSDFDLSLRCAVSPTLVRSSNANIDPSKQNSSYCVQPACVIESSCLKPSCFGPRFSSSKSKKEKKTKPWNEINSNARPLPELIAEPTNARSMSFVGTHEYLAPEIIKGEGHGSAVDWWTLGIFLYELLYGKTPFKGSGNRATLFNVVGEPLRFPDSFSVSFAAKDLIRGLLVKEPQHRLAYRRGATEIKRHPFFQSINWALIRCTKPPEVPKPFIIKFPETNEMHTAPKTLNSPAVDMNPSGNHVEIEFF